MKDAELELVEAAIGQMPYDAVSIIWANAFRGNRYSVRKGEIVIGEGCGFRSPNWYVQVRGRDRVWLSGAAKRMARRWARDCQKYLTEKNTNESLRAIKNPA